MYSSLLRDHTVNATCLQAIESDIWGWLLPLKCAQTSAHDQYWVATSELKTGTAQNLTLSPQNPHRQSTTQLL